MRRELIRAGKPNGIRRLDELATGDPDTVVVTTNAKHLKIFVPARRWQDF